MNTPQSSFITDSTASAVSTGGAPSSSGEQPPSSEGILSAQADKFARGNFVLTVDVFRATLQCTFWSDPDDGPEDRRINKDLVHAFNDHPLTLEFVEQHWAAFRQKAIRSVDDSYGSKQRAAHLCVIDYIKKGAQDFKKALLPKKGWRKTWISVRHVDGKEWEATWTDRYGAPENEPQIQKEYKQGQSKSEEEWSTTEE